MADGTQHQRLRGTNGGTLPPLRSSPQVTPQDDRGGFHTRAGHTPILEGNKIIHQGDPGILGVARPPCTHALCPRRGHSRSSWIPPPPRMDHCLFQSFWHLLCSLGGRDLQLGRANNFSTSSGKTSGTVSHKCCSKSHSTLMSLQCEDSCLHSLLA